MFQSDGVVVQIEVRSYMPIRALGALLKDIEGRAAENKVSPSKGQRVGGPCEQVQPLRFDYKYVQGHVQPRTRTLTSTPLNQVCAFVFSTYS